MSRALYVTLFISALMIALVVYTPGHCQGLAGVIAFIVTGITTKGALARQVPPSSAPTPELTSAERRAERVSALSAALRQLGAGEGPELPSADAPQ